FTGAQADQEGVTLSMLERFNDLDPEIYPIKDDRQFFLQLLEATRVMLVQGTGFNWPHPDHFPGLRRISDISPQTSCLLPQTPDLRLQISDFRFQISDFRFQISDLRPRSQILNT
ncbi:aminotransferase AlaT, partial [Alcaligenes faecalis subsp. faecalis NCIB 8687]